YCMNIMKVWALCTWQDRWLCSLHSYSPTLSSSSAGGLSAVVQTGIPSLSPGSLQNHNQQVIHRQTHTHTHTQYTHSMTYTHRHIHTHTHTRTDTHTHKIRRAHIHTR